MIGELEVIDCLARSDHNMVIWKAYFGCKRQEQSNSRLDYKRADFEGMRTELNGIDWSGILCGNAEEDWVKFKSTLKGVERKYVPAAKKTGGNKRKKAGWITHKAIKSVIKKRRAYAKYKDCKHPAYLAASGRAEARIREAKHNFEAKLAENIKYDSKSFFAYVRAKSKSRVRTGSLLLRNGEILDTDESVAGEFNRYFSEVFSREDVNNIPETEKMEERGCPGIETMDISLERVRRVLRKLRADKSPGADELSPRFLMHVQEEICLPLCIIFRKTLEEGCVPEDWKRANVVPIFKAGSRTKAQNYRPVSLTSQVCKIFETLVRDTIVDYLEGNELLRSTQHGFRKGRSCLTNLLAFLEKVTDGLDKRESIDVVFLDFAKAFDKVPHERLLQKVKSFGIEGNLLRWIGSWLRTRWQRVGVNGAWSEWVRVLSGVPQGSVLGPLLFLIFIDDLDEGLASEILKFADDTKIFGGVNSADERNRMQRDLDRLVEWSEKWQMEFNLDKCKVMHLGARNMEWNYAMNGLRLKVVEEEKDLGVLMSSNLKVTAQCGAAYARANRMLGLVSRTIESRNVEILIRLYKSLVRPHLEYCVSAWSPHYVKDRDRLERVQHRFTRLVPGLRKIGYEERLERLGLMTLEERRNRADLVELFKITRKMSAIPLASFFELNPGVTRGNSLKLKKNFNQSDQRKFFFSQRVVNRWNGLDDDVVRAESVDGFKKGLERMRKVKMGLLRD